MDIFGEFSGNRDGSLGLDNDNEGLDWLFALGCVVWDIGVPPGELRSPGGNACSELRSERVLGWETADWLKIFWRIA